MSPGNKGIDLFAKGLGLEGPEEHDPDEFRDSIRCPHCGEYDDEHTDYPDGLRHDGDTAEMDCAYCEKPFKIRLCVSYEYATAALPEVPKCATCGGTGAVVAVKWMACADCGGTGKATP